MLESYIHIHMNTCMRWHIYIHTYIHTQGNKGWCHMVEDDYEWVTEELCAIARDYANGRVVSVLEGGYHTERAAPLVQSR